MNTTHELTPRQQLDFALDLVWIEWTEQIANGEYEDWAEWHRFLGEVALQLIPEQRQYEQIN